MVYDLSGERVRTVKRSTIERTKDRQSQRKVGKVRKESRKRKKEK